MTDRERDIALKAQANLKASLHAAAMLAGGRPLPDGPDPATDVIAVGKRVADQISALEARLASVHFRVDCEVWNPDRSYGLGFDRSGDKWALYYHRRWWEEEELPPRTVMEEIVKGSMGQLIPRKHERTERELLKDVSLVRKADAILLASSLIRHMQKVHAQRLHDFRQAAASVDDAMMLLDRLAKEGA